MILDKVNVYINSKNRTSGTSSQFWVNIPEGLLNVYDIDEYFTLNVVNFSCIYSWYNCNKDFNDTFYVIEDNGIPQQFRIPEGNPNIHHIKKYLNSVLGNIITVTYDVLKNIWTFTKLDNVTDMVELEIGNCEDFLGFSINDRGIRKVVYSQAEVDADSSKSLLTSSQPINVLGDESIGIKIGGNIFIGNNNIDNYSSTEFVPSSIIFTKSIDVKPYGLIQYTNEDGGNSFQFRLNNNTIESFSLTVVNQDGEIIPNFTEYTLCLQFTKNRIDNDVKNILQQILDFIRQIYFMVGRAMIGSSNKKK